MSRVIAQVTLDRDSGLPADVITNTYHFEDDSVKVEGGLAYYDNVPGLISRLATFYQAIGVNLANTLAGTGTIKITDWDTPKPRVPYAEEAFTFTPGTDSLPGEVALCISFRAARSAGQVAARRRGRVFIGPLTKGTAANPTTGGADPRPADITMTQWLSHFRTMARGDNGTYRLAVYSPTALGANPNDPDAAWNDATDAWMDNAFDTVRSRGAAVTKRFAGSLSGTEAFALAA